MIMKDIYQVKYKTKNEKKSNKDSEIELHETTVQFYKLIYRNKSSSNSNSFDIQKVTTIGVALIKVIEFLMKIFGGASGK